MTVGGLKRTYRTYVPRGLVKGAALVVVMHGAGENGAQIRVWTGYGFERLADEHGFAVVYPNAYEGYWDVCNIVGDVSANGVNIDDDLPGTIRPYQRPTDSSGEAKNEFRDQAGAMSYDRPRSLSALYSHPSSAMIANKYIHTSIATTAPMLPYITL